MWALADLSVTPPESQTQVLNFSNPPERDVQVEMLDGSPQEQAAKLVDRLLEEKVL